jgi:hypothetical protein
LRTDDNKNSTQAVLGSSSPLQNSLCSVDARSATVAGSGNTLTLTLPVRFSKFPLSKNIYTFGGDKAGIGSGWQKTGTWSLR